MNDLLKWTVLGLAIYCAGCGSAARPANAYGNAADLMADMASIRDKISSFRITGKVDHFGVEHRIQGKVFLFAQLPSKLRVDLLSPFGSTLSVLTVNDRRTTMLSSVSPFGVLVPVSSASLCIHAYTSGLSTS